MPELIDEIRAMALSDPYQLAATVDEWLPKLQVIPRATAKPTAKAAAKPTAKSKSSKNRGAR